MIGLNMMACSPKTILSLRLRERRHAPQEGPENSGFFIATAAYTEPSGSALRGTPFDEDIDALRDFRDTQLLETEAGSDFVELYYDAAPAIADEIDDHSWMRAAVRKALKPLVKILEWFQN